MSAPVVCFGERLSAAMADRGPLCVGIDPHPALLKAWGLADDPGGLERFVGVAVEALAGELAVLKPQSAFFERHGSRGVAVLERLIADARQAGALVLLDVKRGDVGSTMQAYADAYLDPRSTLSCDAITVSPYPGFGSLDPVIDTAIGHGRGVFVLALTSNPEGAAIQQARTGTGRTVAGDILAAISARNRATPGLGSVGAVVGATVGLTGEDLDIDGPMLAPGFGAQGGTVENLRRVFGGALRNVVPSTSRAVLSAGPEAVALRDAARRAVHDVAAALDRT